MKNIVFKLLPIIIFFTSLLSYSSFSHKVPVTYWDEVLWIGRSSFFQFYMQGDLNNPIWQSYESYDQPKLAEYLYGIWLYPRYLSEKAVQNDNEFDYTRFLIKNGFYGIDGETLNEYEKYYESQKSNIVKMNVSDSGFFSDYLRKYGSKISNTINIIYQARIINFFLLAAATLVCFFIAKKKTDLITSIFITFFYTYNSLIIITGIKAQSEALFILLFNLAILTIIIYFENQKKITYLFLASLLIGLCISTKLNGSMLLIALLITQTLHFFIFEKNKKVVKFLAHFFVPIVFSLMVFILLNPFTYSHPFNKTKYMFAHRQKTAQEQISYVPKSFLPNPHARLKIIIYNFFFSEDEFMHSNLYIFPQFVHFSKILFVLFLIGVISELWKAKKGDPNSIVLIVFFSVTLLTMSQYLVLNWPRYYIQLVIFFVIYQCLGAKYLVTTFLTFVLKHNNKPFKKTSQLKLTKKLI